MQVDVQLSISLPGALVWLWGIRQITQDFRERRAVSNGPTQASDYDVSADRVKPDHSVAKDFSG